MNFYGTQSSCEFCGVWVQDVDIWSCEECSQCSCEKCGRYDRVEDVFLCPECFAKPGKKDKE
jgi:hypothetical protein